MPEVTFTIETEATTTRLDLNENYQLIPVDLIHGVGVAELPSGYVGNAVLTLLGEIGTTATLKITQKVGDVDVVLEQADQIEITHSSGQSVSFIAFIVQ